MRRAVRLLPQTWKKRRKRKKKRKRRRRRKRKRRNKLNSPTILILPLSLNNICLTFLTGLAIYLSSVTPRQHEKPAAIVAKPNHSVLYLAVHFS
jgi:hypothetical protein